MPVYQYETLPAVPDGPVRRFEVKQSMNDRPLEKHPETGEPVRRVISGGFLMLKPGASSGGDGAGAMAPSAPCGGSCACHP
jgi:predicted nucleic acid-binding Zn ribbon protein